MLAQKKNPAEGSALLRIDVKILPELYELVAKEADAINVPLGEFLVRLAAEKVGRPELGYVPREKPGRKRKKRAAV